MFAGCAGKNSAADFTAKEQAKAAKDLVNRVTDGRANEFDVIVTLEQKDGKDWFAYYAKDGRVVLEGNNGVSVASALGH